MLNRIFVVDSVTLTSTGTAVSSYTPWDQTTRKLPTQVVVKATGQGAYVRLSNDASAATNADVLVQGGDHVVLSVQGRRWVSVLSDGASSTVNVGALSTGVSGSAASLDLPFTGVSALDSRITFTRASSATFTGSNGLIQSAAIDAPRFDYDPVTLAAKGLLIEEQRTNLLLQSETFDNAYWALLNATVTANAAVAPSGATSADKLVETAATGDHRILNNLGETVTSGATYTWSVFAKAGERTSVRVVNNNISGATFDLTNGSSSNVSGGITAASFNFGNGWYRLSISGNAVTTTERIGVYLVSGGNTNYTGDGTSGAFIWGAQLELGAFSTSYIPTVASQVTRNADSASMLGDNFYTWYNPNQGTLSAEFDQYSITSPNNQWAAAISDNTANNYIGSLTNPSSYRGLVVSGGATQASIINGAVAANTIVKSSLAYKVNDFAATSGGAAVITDTSGTVPSVTQMSIGAFNGAVPINGHIRRITYYPRRLSNAELQAITA